MRAFWEVVMAALAVLGLLSLSWLVLGRLLIPIGGRESVTLLPGTGDGETLEQALNGLVWLRDGGLLNGKILIADCGLTAAGKALAIALALRQPEVEVCPAARIAAYLKGGH